MKIGGHITEHPFAASTILWEREGRAKMQTERPMKTYAPGQRGLGSTNTRTTNMNKMRISGYSLGIKLSNIFSLSYRSSRAVATVSSRELVNDLGSGK